MIKDKVHAEHKCTLCGYQYNCHPFKSGFVCEDCLQWIKDKEQPTNLQK